MHTQPAGRQNRNVISIIMTFSLVMYSFYDKILFFESSSLYWQLFFDSCEREVLKSPWMLFFTVKSLIDKEYFFIGNCIFFINFDQVYTELSKNSVCKIFLSRTSLNKRFFHIFPKEESQEVMILCKLYVVFLYVWITLTRATMWWLKNRWEIT